MQTKLPGLLLTGLLVASTSIPAFADVFNDTFGWSSSTGSTSAPAAAPIAATPAENATSSMAAPLPAGSDGLPGSFSLGSSVADVPAVPPPEPMSIPEAGGSIGNLPAEATLPMVETAPVQPEPPRMTQGELDSRMWDAARAGDAATVAAMLQQGANLSYASHVGETALHAATAAGSLQTVILLVNAGADVNATTSNGWTPLHHAARFGQADIANFLVNHGANINAATTENPPKTPMQMALDKGDLRIARMLGY